MTSKPLLSIVITSYTMERLKDVLELLDSIRRQTYPDTDTIVVVEKSVQLLERIGHYAAENTQPPVRVVFNSGEPGLSAARNLGIKEAKGNIIAFVDDDALVALDWAEEMMKTYEDDSVIGVTGAISPLWQDDRADWFPIEFDWILSSTGFASLNGVREVRNVFGANMSFRREAFDESGLFLTSLGAKGGGASGKHELVGDETELSIRVRRKTGKRLIFNPEVRAGHKVFRYRITPKFIARRAYWEGFTKALFSHNYRESQTGEKLLKVEHDLLGRIITHLFPEILGGFFKHPVVAWRKLWVTTIALASTAAGYLMYSLLSLLGRRKIMIRAGEI